MTAIGASSCTLAEVPPWRWAGTTSSAAGDARAAVMTLGTPLRVEAVAVLWAMHAIREAKREIGARSDFPKAGKVEVSTKATKRTSGPPGSSGNA
ncbi:MAG TPA: hypothetical protein VMV91_14845 [Rhodocyclaceae bacterium]|nr:hypothetical protein [Rhodocyclaceae bacterium]